MTEKARCNRLLNLTITSEDEEREESIRCVKELGHEGRCAFPQINRVKAELVVVK